MLKVTRGSIFDGNHQVIVNPVNCVGVMGKGLAKSFKLRYPDMFEHYKIQCLREKVRIGLGCKFETDDGVLILCAPTKDHWRSKSNPWIINSSLDWIYSELKRIEFCSVGIPAIGCGEGGLNFNDVLTAIEFKLTNLNHDIHVYRPEKRH